MRILIIGGSRFIGLALVHRLHDQGHTLCLFHRHLMEAPLPPEITHLYGDRSRIDKFAQEFRDFGPDVVIDMIPLTERDAQGVVRTFRSITGRVIAISSQDVYRAYGHVNGLEVGPLDPVPLTEDSPLRERFYPYRGDALREPDDPARFQDDYEKILVEQVVMGTPDLPGTVLRLPMVYGPNDYQHRLFEYLKRMDDGRPVIVLSERIARWRWTRDYVENSATAIALAATAPQAAGRVYNVGEADALSMSGWVHAIASAAGWTGRLVILPDAALPDPLRVGPEFEQDLAVDTSRIRRDLGFVARIGRDEALRRTIAFEREHPPARINPAQFDYAAEDELLARLS